ncbi:MAG: VanZ family protein [Thermoanaerobaculia bacterium]
MAQVPLALAVLAVVASLSLRRTRWARPSLWVSRLTYAGLVLQAPLYFLVKGGFQLSAPDCEWTFGLALARHSLTNYPHIVLFTLFFLLTYAQMRGVRRPILWSAVATMAMGLLVELAQGVSGHGHCRMRDLVPDSLGALLGLAIVTAGTTLLQSRQRRQA